MIGLPAAVAVFNRAAQALDVARLLLYREADAAEAARTRRRDRAECGTDSGYNRHRWQEETPCPACTEAHTRYRRRRECRRWAA